MHNYRSALVYFDSVLENYYDTEYVRPTLYWRAECLFKLERYEESVDAFKAYVDRYPQDRYAARANDRLEEMQAEIAEVQETNGTSY
jgi:outer membrane protein assembly factor BamD (BamD/ComL family)